MITRYATCQTRFLFHYFKGCCFEVQHSIFQYEVSQGNFQETQLNIQLCSSSWNKAMDQEIISPEGSPCYWDVLIVSKITSWLIGFFAFAKRHCLVFPNRPNMQEIRHQLMTGFFSIQKRRCLMIDVQLKPTLLSSKYFFPLLAF